MHAISACNAVPVACFAGLRAFRNNCAVLGLLRDFYTARADRVDDSLNASTGITPSQLQRLNELGTLPSVARHWDGDAALAELRSAASDEGFATRRPTAVQQMLAKRHGLPLPLGAPREAAASRLSAVRPPSVQSLALLYGVLDHQGAVPNSAAAARQVLRDRLMACPHPHPLDVDLSPVAKAQMECLADSLGFVGRPPFSYSAAQLMISCVRTVVVDSDDEGRTRQLPQLQGKQADAVRLLITHLRSRRVPPGTRGVPLVQDLDLGLAAHSGVGEQEAGRSGDGRSGSSSGWSVSRLAAARHVLQLLQNHELCATPTADSPVVRQLYGSLGHRGPVPPTIGEATMLAQELRDRCMRPTQAQLSALRAVGYFDGAAGGGRAVPAGPVPDNVATVKAIFRVMRRADLAAAAPASRRQLDQLGALRRRALSLAGGSTAGAVGPCPSSLEVEAAVEALPLSHEMLERLVELGWVSGPMPATHGSAVALEEFLMSYNGSRTGGAGTGTAGAAAGTAGAGSPGAVGAGMQGQELHPGGSPGSMAHQGGATATVASADAHSGSGGSLYGSGHRPPPPASYQPSYDMSRLAASPEELLVKAAIRSLYRGAVSEWHLPTMCHDEARHVLACLRAARGSVAARARGPQYDEYVERWPASDADAEWWSMEWLWSSE